MLQDVFYPIIQEILGHEATAEYWMCKGQPGNAASWQRESLRLQRRLLAQAVTLRLFGVTGQPREFCHKTAGVLAGYCKDIGGPYA